MMNVFAVVHQQIWKPCGTLSVHDYYSDENATSPPNAPGLSSLSLPHHNREFLDYSTK